MPEKCLVPEALDRSSEHYRVTTIPFNTICILDIEHSKYNGLESQDSWRLAYACVAENVVNSLLSLRILETSVTLPTTVLCHKRLRVH